MGNQYVSSFVFCGFVTEISTSLHSFWGFVTETITLIHVFGVCNGSKSARSWGFDDQERIYMWFLLYRYNLCAIMIWHTPNFDGCEVITMHFSEISRFWRLLQKGAIVVSQNVMNGQMSQHSGHICMILSVFRSQQKRKYKFVDSCFAINISLKIFHTSNIECYLLIVVVHPVYTSPTFHTHMIVIIRI